MKKKLFQNKLIVKKSKLHGYGVFAAKAIKKGELIEDCYMLVTKNSDKYFRDYYFDVNGKNAILLGFGCIYNHSEDPNADYDIMARKKLASFYALRKIKKGEEIFVSYGDDWFKNRKLKPK